MHKIHFIQRLRIGLTALVVAHHAGQAYGPTGGAWPIHDATTAWLGPFFGLNAAFFMGMFFLLAGLFTSQSYDHKGPVRYVRDRLIQLGLPVLIFASLVLPFLAYLWQHPDMPFAAFWLDFFRVNGLQLAHLWFVAWLLVLSLAYALWRLLPFGRNAAAIAAPGALAVGAYVAVLALTNAGVRLVYDQETWITIAGLPIEPVHVPQYLSLYVIGLFAGRGRWLETIRYRTSALWFGAAVIAFAAAVAVIVSGVDLPAFLPEPVFAGGLEAVVCVGMILGLVGLFRWAGSRPSRLVSALDANCYGIYLVHWPVVIPVQGAMLGLALSPTVKFAIATLATWVLSLMLAETWRRLGGLRLPGRAAAAAT